MTAGEPARGPGIRRTAPFAPARCGAASRRAAVAALALAIAAIAAPRYARANAEEFSNFGVERQEQDDETVLDHLMARLPLEWRDAWERAPLAFRTSQGCHTSGEWFQLTDLKLETALGRRARFGFEYTQRVDNVVSYEDIALRFRYPIRFGRVSVDFHPAADKSRQDFSLSWESASDTAAFYARATFTVEDMLNNLWQQRQARVGHLSEPYLRHPYLPELEFAARHEHWRARAGGRYLTPSRKHVLGLDVYTLPSEVTLWGAYGWGTLEAEAMGFRFEGRGENRQASSTEQPLDYSSGDHRDFRRQWSGEGALSRAIGTRSRVLARWFYQSRTQLYGPPVGPGRFDAIDRILQLEASREYAPGWRLAGGALVDRLSFARRGGTPWISERRDKESRAFLSLQARFGKVSVEGVETIELDAEPYQVSAHHDKGFLRLQTTF